MYRNENEFKADNSALNMSDVIRSCNQLSREQLCKAYDILHNGFKSKSHYSLKVQEMKSIICGATQPCCSFERWLLLIEYLKSVGCNFA